MCLHLINVFFISNTWIFNIICLLSLNICSPPLGPVYQQRGKSSLWPHTWGGELMVFSEITAHLKCINYKRFLSLCHWRYQSCIFLPVADTERDTAKSRKKLKISSRLEKAVFVFLNNGHVKVKVLIMAVNTEGKSALFGFSFSVQGAALIPQCQLHHKVGAKWAGEKTEMKSLSWELELTWKAGFFILGGAPQIPRSRERKKLNWFRV